LQDTLDVIMTLREVARQTQTDRRHRLLVRFCRTLGQRRPNKELLEEATRLIPGLIDAQGAAVLLLDNAEQAFCVPTAFLDDASVGVRFKDVRLPADKEMAGDVCRAGRAIIAHDLQNSPFASAPLDQAWGHTIRDRLDVPLIIQNRAIGVLSAINKNEARFDQQDAELLGAVADLTALALENIHLHETLVLSHQRMQAFDQAKNHVIDHVSHALKTPLAVLIASLKLLEKHLALVPGGAWRDVYHRAQRNLARLLHIEYEVEDILRQSDDSGHAPPWPLPHMDARPRPNGSTGLAGTAQPPEKDGPQSIRDKEG
jgi:GAF domain-containing protein